MAAPTMQAKAAARAASSMPVQTRTAEAGDLFEYEIATPVTVKRNQSALVPIVHQAVQVKRVSHYNESVRAKNPMSALLLKNTTGLTLEGGPMTVLENETYVGEAMLDTMKADEERLVPFSVELSVLMRSETDTTSGTVYRYQITNSYAHMHRHVYLVRNYFIDNTGAKDVELHLDHPIRGGYVLVDTQKPKEQTDNYYRFVVSVPAKKAIKFVVKERGDESNSYSISNVTTEQIVAWYSSKFISDEVRATLERIAGWNARTAELATKDREAEAQRKLLNDNNERLRKTIPTLNDTDREQKLRVKYVEQLEEIEVQLKAIEEAWQARSKEREEIQREVRKLLTSLTFDRTVANE